MSERTDTPITLVKALGCTTDEARLYITLLELGVVSALTLSRKLRMGRTKVYRILDKLVVKNLAVMHVREQGFAFAASSPQVLEQLIIAEEKKVEGMRQMLPTVLTELTALTGAGKKNSKVLYYEGIEGVKQMSYNSLRANRELLTMEVGTLNDFFSYQEAEAMRVEFVKAGIKVRTLTNQDYIAPWTDNQVMAESFWQIRQIPKQQFEIGFEILLYSNVYSLYRYEGEQVFGVEVYDDYLSQMQRSLFEYLWDQAKVFEVVGVRGEARVIE
jgi:sugar-specific transcriptional regulator TrmB